MINIYFIEDRSLGGRLRTWIIRMLDKLDKVLADLN